MLPRAGPVPAAKSRNQRSESMFEKVDGMMATYVEAVEDFSRSVKEFLQHVHRYQEAVAASAELRKVLDNGDETLRMLRTQLEQAIGTPFVQQVLDEKKLETIKFEALRASAGGAGVVK